MPSLPAPGAAPMLMAFAVLMIAPLAWGVRRIAARAWRADARLIVILALGAGMSLTAIVAAGDDVGLSTSLALGWVLIALAMIDISIQRLPDALTLPLLAGGLAVHALKGADGLADHVIGAVVGYAALAGLAVIYRRLRGRDGLGLGDAKLLAAAGAWLGWRHLPAVLLIASLAGLAMAAVTTAQRKSALASTPIAFGPALALATWVCWLATQFTSRAAN